MTGTMQPLRWNTSSPTVDRARRLGGISVQNAKERVEAPDRNRRWYGEDGNLLKRFAEPWRDTALTGYHGWARL